MHKSVIAIFLLAATLLVLIAPGNAGQLPGASIPLSLQFKDLHDGWKQFNLPDDSVKQLWTTLGPLLQGKVMPPNLYYTRGELLDCGGETFLVAYQQAGAGFDRQVLANWVVHDAFDRIGRGNEAAEDDPGESTKYPPCYAPDPMQPGGTISLTLLNIRQLDTIGEMRAFNLEKAMAEVNEDRFRGLRMGRLFDLRLMARYYNEEVNEGGALPALVTMADARRWFAEKHIPLRQPYLQAAYLPNPSLKGLEFSDIPLPAETPVFYDAHPALDGSRGVAYLDGKSAIVPANEWEGLRKKWALPDDAVSGDL